MSEENHIIHLDGQPIEISVKVSNEVTAKGDLKPSAELRVTRKLTDDTNVETIIRDVLELGVAETSKAIQKALGKEEEEEVKKEET